MARIGKTGGWRALRLALAASVLGLGACASSPEIGRYADGDPRSARMLLQEVNSSGPMAVVVQGPVPGGLDPAQVAQALGAEVVGTSAQFVAQPEASAEAARVILLFGPPEQLSPWRACGPEAVLGSGFGDTSRLMALVCDGPSTVAHLRAAAASDSEGDVSELLRRTGHNLFPDPYAERYSYDRYGGYGYGGYGSFGTSGSSVGVGIGFGF
ncbi:hypothetical protein [Geminicoccus roseus]|uniref:hypothetical protein n=1 Tax=Geminicoccus roseus TaxID=404900 RepID=UPI0003F6D5C5|nr:hypothetical protein [Geminicoccus roseus]